MSDNELEYTWDEGPRAGETYAGEWKNYKFHGKGKYTYMNGATYEGEWKDGEYHGKGHFIYPDDVADELEEWGAPIATVDPDIPKSHDEPPADHGWVPGGCRMENGAYYGESYEGEYKNGKMHGKGTYISNNGMKYVGEFQNGLKHGKGTLDLPNGTKYVGEFKNEWRHGKGTLTFDNGDKLVAEFENDVQHGQGVYTYAKGNKY